MKDGTKLILWSAAMVLATIFCLHIGLSLMKSAVHVESIVALLMAASGAVHLVFSMCTFVLALEFLCNGIRKLK
jgi:hypothetical protein